MMIRCIEITISLDGADLTRTVSHVMVGIKIIDRFARHGLHGDYILKTKILPDRSIVIGSGYQSRHNCVPFLIILGKNNSATYENEHLKEFFIFQGYREKRIHGLQAI